ncbi:hypothetical protein SteCoe_22940 [Stentor coeruleus]|uniref:Uncharacterized protein n=1 Tax=Stentor coeruleus TaxID=5963 RepID=A0A1R2BKY9_9CILI|nr:hypothetical protein SteCoe_22940 [Stentor coeruleus]
MDSFSERQSECSSVIDTDEQKSSLKETMKKIVIAKKQLRSYEKLLADKERIIEERSQNLKEQSDKLAQEKRLFESQFHDFLSQKENLELEQALLNKEKLEFHQSRQKFHLKKSKHKQAKSEISALQTKTEENFKRSEFIKIQQQQDYENIKKAQEKIKRENAILLAQINTLAEKRNELEKIKESIEKTQKSTEEDKQKVKNELERIRKLKDDLTKERVVLRKEIKDTENARKKYEDDSYVRGSVCSTARNNEPSEANKLMESLQAQIEVYNKEISIRELRLQEKEAKLLTNQSLIYKNYQRQLEIESSLKKTKDELNVINKDIISELENLYNTFKNIIEETKTKAQIIRNLCEKITQDSELITEIKALTAEQQNRIDKQIEEINLKEKRLLEMSHNIEERQSNMSFTSDTRVDSLIGELEGNIRALKDKQEDINKEAEENSKTAEYLKKSIQEIEESKSSLMKEKMKIREKNVLIEKKQKTLNDKYSELETVKKALDMKAIELKFLEKELSFQKIKNSELFNGSGK